MKRNIRLGRRGWVLIALSIAAIFSANILGGSAIWLVVGGVSNLAISGTAKFLRAAPSGVGDAWSAYGGDAGGSRYSSADLITPGNVASLEVAWKMNTGALAGKGDAVKRSAFETTPILANEKLVFCTQFNEVIALDPASGGVDWRYDPFVATNRKPSNQYTCRGVSSWKDKQREEGVCSRRIFTGTVDSRLIALDAETGLPCRDLEHRALSRSSPISHFGGLGKSR